MIKKMHTGLDINYPLFMSVINQIWIFSTDFRKILKYHMSCKSVQWKRSCSMRRDRHDEAYNRFSQFCERV